jgi:hypothetical protein
MNSYLRLISLVVGKLSVRTKLTRLIAALVLPLAIGACKSEKKAAASSGTASGEVLPGSASDAMLPYDAVRSLPPMSQANDTSDSTSEKSAAKPRSNSEAARPKLPEAESAPSPATEVMPVEE